MRHLGGVLWLSSGRPGDLGRPPALLEPASGLWAPTGASENLPGVPRGLEEHPRDLWALPMGLPGASAAVFEAPSTFQLLNL